MVNGQYIKKSVVVSVVADYSSRSGQDYYYRRPIWSACAADFQVEEFLNQQILIQVKKANYTNRFQLKTSFERVEWII